LPPPPVIPAAAAAPHGCCKSPAWSCPLSSTNSPQAARPPARSCSPW
jgi:hypothetical protein